jgi:leucyl/phenylalanyl-tRNA--protein transferase
MPVFRLSERLEFPNPGFARFDGLLCIGGDLSIDRILLAYRSGIFPWYSKNEPLLWWSPDPRLILYPGELRISRSLRKKIRHNVFTITMDQAFDQVIHNCAGLRTDQGEDTWLVEEMIHAYTELHKNGYAHSVEVWKDGALAGGLYGLSLGGCFFGESMFTKISDASKTALAALSHHLVELNFDLIDCQVTSDHLLSMGAVEISRDHFLTTIHSSLERDDLKGPWCFKGFHRGQA